MLPLNCHSFQLQYLLQPQTCVHFVFTPPFGGGGCGSYRVLKQRHQRTKRDFLSRNSKSRVRPGWNRTLTVQHQHWVHKSPVSVGETTESIYNSMQYSKGTVLFTVPLNGVDLHMWYFLSFPFNHIHHTLLP